MQGVYCITNKTNNKVYIGKAINIERRWSEHRAELKGGYHINKHLQSAYNKYGENNFEFKVLEYCNESELNEKEIYYISLYKAYDPKYGYNKTYGGDGVKPTEEVKLKISKALKGKRVGSKVREDVKIKISNSMKGVNVGSKNGMYGKTHTEETRRKLSIINKGKYVSEETREKLRKINIGREYKQEWRENMSKALKGRKSAFKGKNHSIETKYSLSKNSPSRKLNDEQILEIVKLYATNEKITYKVIAEKYGVAQMTVYNIINGITHTRLNNEINEIIDEVLKTRKARS